MVGTVRPNITSSFENPNTNASLRSISTTSMSSPNSSDSLVVSSRPPNPAPSTSTRIVTPPQSTTTHHDVRAIRRPVAVRVSFRSWGRDRPASRPPCRGRPPYAQAHDGAVPKHPPTGSSRCCGARTGRSAGRSTRARRRCTRRTGSRSSGAPRSCGGCRRRGAGSPGRCRVGPAADARRGPPSASCRAGAMQQVSRLWPSPCTAVPAIWAKVVGEVDVLGHARCDAAGPGPRARRPRAGRGCRCRRPSSCPASRRYSPMWKPLSELNTRYVLRRRPDGPERLHDRSDHPVDRLHRLCPACGRPVDLGDLRCASAGDGCASQGGGSVGSRVEAGGRGACSPGNRFGVPRGRHVRGVRGEGRRARGRTAGASAAERWMKSTPAPDRTSVR